MLYDGTDLVIITFGSHKDEVFFVKSFYEHLTGQSTEFLLDK